MIESHRDRLHLIVAPCGAGKTTLAIKKLSVLYGNRNRALYLIDTVAGQDQLLQNPEFQRYRSEWRKSLSDPECEGDGRLTVMTYACFGTLCRHFPDWYLNLDVLICDEIQTLLEMRAWESREKSSEEQLISELAYGVIVRSAMQREISAVFALTATPRPLYKDLEDCDEAVPERPDLFNIIHQVPLTGVPKRYKAS